jgi:4'-phosphopantetheinyl transferase
VPTLRLWRIDLDAPAPPEQALGQLLDDAEQGRALALADAGLRSRFLRAHASLRLILSSLLRCQSAEIPLGTDEPDGKPRIERAWLKRRQLDFSLSHSGSQALVGIAQGGGKVGVDLEARGAPAGFRALAERLFTPAELAWLWREPPAKQGFRFLQCWTRKEAYLKAIGKGFSRKADGFRCRLDAAGNVLGSASDASGRALSDWQALPLDEPPTAACAVVDFAPVDLSVETFAWPALHGRRRTGHFGD